MNKVLTTAYKNFRRLYFRAACTYTVCIYRIIMLCVRLRTRAYAEGSKSSRDFNLSYFACTVLFNLMQSSPEYRSSEPPLWMWSDLSGDNFIRIEKIKHGQKQPETN